MTLCIVFKQTSGWMRICLLRFRYFSVGRHEDTVDKNDEHHWQTEERAGRIKVLNSANVTTQPRIQTSTELLNY